MVVRPPGSTLPEHRSIDVRVKKEELVIERHAVGRHPASGPIGENGRGADTAQRGANRR